MRKEFVYFILLVLLLPFTVKGQGNGVKIIRYEGLDEVIRQEKGKLTIVNFWATWCVPCVEEIPHFVEVYNERRKVSDLAIVFVSLDRAAHLDKVRTFAKGNRLPGSVVLLDDVKRYNEWIPKIYADWGGTLPATGFYRDGELLAFFPNELSKEELITIIDKLKEDK